MVPVLIPRLFLKCNFPLDSIHSFTAVYISARDREKYMSFISSEMALVQLLRDDLRNARRGSEFFNQIRIVHLELPETLLEKPTDMQFPGPLLGHESKKRIAFLVGFGSKEYFRGRRLCFPDAFYHLLEAQVLQRSMTSLFIVFWLAST